YPRYLLPFFIVSLFAILGAVLVPSAGENSARFNCMMIGVFLIGALQFILWPWYVQDETRFVRLQTLQHLKELTHEIFSCFLHPDYQTNVYLYERRIHLQK